MNTTYENFKKENRLRLFGHEDAGKEDEDRLSSYYYKTSEYEDVISNIDFQIVTGEKGTGKSALLKMAYKESADLDIVPIWIRLDDLSELYTEILNSDDLYKLKTLWKKAIGKLVVMNLASYMNFYLSEDCEKAVKWAYESGYASRDFVSKTVTILKPMHEKYVNLDSDYNSCGEHHILERVIKKKRIRLFLDDFDLDWKGNESDVLKIKSLILSLSDMTSDITGLSARIALRTDVYEMIRNEEFSDKFESSIIKCKWNNQEIMRALAKRICTYFGQTFDEQSTAADDTLQYNIIQYFNYVFVPNFDESTKVWPKAPTHRVIYSLIRRKPRDMVKLCQNVSEEAYNKKLSVIDTNCFLSVLEMYSQERLKDLVNEYKNQMPVLNDLLLKMAPTRKEFETKKNERYVYTTSELHEKIKNIQSNINVQIYLPEKEKMTVADFHQISHFLFRIGFITGRKRDAENRIDRVYYDEMPNLLNKNIGDKGYAWEIHPAYRGALALGKKEQWETTFSVVE